MVFSNKQTATFVGGEVTPNLSSREDIPIWAKSVERCENFIVKPEGPVDFRTGTIYVHHTRLHQAAVFIPFQFNDQQSYLIEATNQRFRFYKNNGIVLETAIAVGGITNANPGVWTVNAHGFETGDEIVISGVVGMSHVNGRSFLVVKINANTFSLTDIFGTALNTTSLGTATSPGTVARVYEIITPYEEANLQILQYAQTADTMYITSQVYEMRKLTRSSDTSWSLARYTRTTDPFQTAKTITNITQANPGVVTSASHALVDGDRVFIDAVVGMTEVNNRFFTVAGAAANTFQLSGENTTGYTAYSSAGKAELVGARKYPACVCFTDDSRLAFANTLNNTETMWFSKGPSSAGALQFDIFTTGSAASDGLKFTLAPLRGKVDSIRWMTNTDKYIAVGTYGSIRRLYGASEAEPITPTSVTAKAANADGVDICLPAVDGATTMYVARGGQSLQTLEFDYQVDGYVPNDQNLVSYHLTEPGLLQIVRQISRPVVIWALRNDGVLLGMTYKAKENIAGWHRHSIGGPGNGGFVEWMGVMPRDTDSEQLWLIVKRTINGHTVRHVEYFADVPHWPEKDSFYTNDTYQVEDTNRFLSAQYEQLKQAIHMDSCATYDGSAYGTAASATLTAGVRADTIDEVDVVFTASAAVFTSDMVGRQIWGAFDTATGYGGGRAQITSFTSTTSVKCTILSEFLSDGYTFDPGDWFITATTLSNLEYLEGEIVGVVTDGAVTDNQLVEDGSLTISEPASIIHVGFKYRGIIKTLPIDQGGQSGPAQSKNKNVIAMAPRFINSNGVQFGTDLYSLQDISFRAMNDITGRPIPLFSGSIYENYHDGWEENKQLYILQDKPNPCTVACIDIYCDTSDEG